MMLYLLLNRRTDVTQQQLHYIYIWEGIIIICLKVIYKKDFLIELKRLVLPRKLVKVKNFTKLSGRLQQWIKNATSVARFLVYHRYTSKFFVYLVVEKARNNIFVEVWSIFSDGFCNFRST